MTVDFKTGLNRRYWEYQKCRFSEEQGLFERLEASDRRPPVFIPSESERNILIDPEASQEEKEKLLSFVPAGEKHRWYRSMNSSQALAQSILGNLAIYDCLHILSEIKADEGPNPFGGAQISSENFVMESRVHILGERRSTSPDGFICGDYQIAIECKFTEAEIGTCSRPHLKPTASNYGRDHCNGTYSLQRERKERCSLTEIGVKYWHYVPGLFKWQNDGVLDPCPLYRNYQLVRNVLAAGVKPDGTVSVNHGHAVLIYDERNPAFQNGGRGSAAYRETLDALGEPAMLRKCSWQRILQQMRHEAVLPWLTEELTLKYGL